MAEHIATEKFSYFCEACASEYNEPGRQFSPVHFRKCYFHCQGCRRMYSEGVRTPKINLTDTSSHLCDECGNRYQRMSDLLHHICKNSGQWPFRCAFCQTDFDVYSVLEVHMRRRDYVLRLFCRNCSAPFLGKICPGVYDQLIITDEFYCESCSNGSRNIEYVSS
ncbi:hypothetical protein TNCT_117971 [Trichonephila clavata]|uniref:C2H2-type domain-containing protein n=1 Tax=Trichonephila clavata TaxID=2740835 RepID=A0A8X6KDQ4_TRICU|nr:hypothetical protein TNCT_117971 [Trichonephila clavata]